MPLVSLLFTQEAKNFANGKPIDLIDGTQLEKLIFSLQAAEAIVEPVQSIDDTNRVCPQCGSVLALRIAKKGQNAGNQFWGCTSFPNCRYVGNI